ncbi:SCO family protein [Georhizobium profundi]|jgi:protein SCO1/2|uniref:SCO family protein n=2 Tax=Hyphomicrobiales TaxID=356 RepID=A0A3S9AZI8_9HYPH|nr:MULTISPECIES: SCO family protein [Hyphomicrobiales]AZN70032.1 SCO family protein [Georhizobium profundi]MCO6390002.1 redoxin domain-containing protein [Aliihoeflea aestuarii]MDF1598995.1 SCO family protein [Mesorhizobium sp. YIM 152430]TYR29515.1 SCO family protein [Mesorhizobium microcysteis]
MSFVRLFRIGVWVAIAVLGTYLVVSTQMTAQRQPVEASTGAARVGGPFSLVSHEGERVDNQSLAGRPYVVFFGFTHCPEICPTTLFELTDLMGELGPDADKLEVLFVTVDPERDTQDMLAGYMTSFDSRITALRGTAEETEAALNAFSAYAAKVPLEAGQYTMDHTAGVFLMRGDGSFGGVLDMHEPRETRLEKLRRLASA